MMKLGASSTLAKFLWFKKNKPDVVNRTKLILSTSDYIYYKLTGKAVIDYTSAGMMGAYDNDKNAWDNRLLNLVGISEDKLPKILSAGEYIGNANEKFLEDALIKGDVKVYVGLHDQFSASLGANYFSKRDVVISTGTTWVVFARNDKKLGGVFSPRNHPDGGYGYFNSAVSSGTVLEWTKNTYGVDYKEIDRLAEERPIDEDLFIFPFISGSGVYRGTSLLNYGVEGCAFKHQKGDIFRATMEGVAFEIKYIVDLYKESGFEINNFIVTGGATRSSIWMQILADVLGETLYLSKQVDGCCFGAYSVIKKGETGSFERFEFEGKIVEPNLKNTEVYNSKFIKYNELLQKKYR